MKIWESYAPELVLDLYELTMAASYFDEKMSGDATFSLFIRDYPDSRSYFVSSGIEHLVELLTSFRFDENSLAYISSIGRFSSRFIDYLKSFRFSGTVRAIPEGRIFYTNEPVVEVSAPIIEAQIIETLVINVIQLEVMLASKAARVVHAAGGKGVIDFGMRRSHGVDAAVKAARAGYLVGFSGTSNLMAGKIYGIPVYGTMAHSYVTSFAHEVDSFAAFAKTFPDHTVLLIDTYDTIAGAKKAVETAGMLAANGKQLLGVRLDSGDMAALSEQVRLILDDAGFRATSILASGSLDEFKVEALVKSGAPIDIFAVGTRVCVSADAPFLDIAYKLVEYEGRPILKLSSGKETWVGRKQVYRHYDHEGRMERDVLCLFKRERPEGEPLLVNYIESGERARAAESVDTIRSRFTDEFSKLPRHIAALRPEAHYPVHIDSQLLEKNREVKKAKMIEEVNAFLKSEGNNK